MHCHPVSRCSSGNAFALIHSRVTRSLHLKLTYGIRTEIADQTNRGSPSPDTFVNSTPLT